MYARLRLPLPLLGVPTQIKLTSLSCTADWPSRVARNLPDVTACSMSSSRPFSMTGDRPDPAAATLSRSTSTPTTVWPSRAEQTPQQRTVIGKPPLVFSEQVLDEEGVEKAPTP